MEKFLSVRQLNDITSLLIGEKVKFVQYPIINIGGKDVIIGNFQLSEKYTLKNLIDDYKEVYILLQENNNIISDDNIVRCYVTNTVTDNSNLFSAISDEELIGLAEKTIKSLCKSGGDSFRMSIPPNKEDTDMLFIELLDRFKEYLSNR